MLKTILTATILLITGLTVVACQCVGRGIISVHDYNETDAIFLGTVISSRDSGSTAITRFYVRRWYKGMKGDTATIYSPSDVGACGLGLIKRDSIYLVFAGQAPTGIFGTSRCSRTSTPTGKSFHADTLFLARAVKEVKRDGAHNFFDSTGRLQASGNFLNSLPSGTWKYFQQGRLQETGRYNDGRRDGMWQELGTHISLAQRRWYKDGVYTLQSESYHEPWTVKYDEFYPTNNGLGWVHKIYHPNGRLRVEMPFSPVTQGRDGYLQPGLLHGQLKEYHDNGKIAEQGECYKGFEVGLWRYFDRSGRLIKTEMKKTKEEVDVSSD